MWAHTSDWGDADVAELVAVAGRLDTRAAFLAACWMSESGLRTTAHNNGGDASGLFQAMPATLHLIGFPGDWRAFVALSVRQQLHWAEKYYGPHRGQLVSAGAVYLATFLPAFMPRSNEPLFVLCSATLHPEWYRPNRAAFDPRGRGYITVGDLSTRIAAVSTGPRWTEFAERIQIAEQEATTLPELPAAQADDAPLFILPDEDEPPEGA